MIDPQTAWLFIKQNAEKALKANLQWRSLRKKKVYQLKKILNDRIIIERKSGGGEQQLTEARIIKATNDFNAQQCRVKRRTLISPTVAEETAFVLFHPKLTWDEENEFIIEAL